MTKIVQLFGNDTVLNDSKCYGLLRLILELKQPDAGFVQWVKSSLSNLSCNNLHVFGLEHLVYGLVFVQFVALLVIHLLFS